MPPQISEDQGNGGHYSLTWIQTKLNRDDIDDLTPDAVLDGVQKLNELI